MYGPYSKKFVVGSCLVERPGFTDSYHHDSPNYLYDNRERTYSAEVKLHIKMKKRPIHGIFQRYLHMGCVLSHSLLVSSTETYWPDRFRKLLGKRFYMNLGRVNLLEVRVSGVGSGKVRRSSFMYRNLSKETFRLKGSPSLSSQYE